MSIAKGSRSKLIFATETTFGTARTAIAYNGLLFTNESLVENIETFQSSDIRADRATAAVRGGNVASGGQISADFAINRHAELLLHLLAGTRPSGVSVTLTDLTSSTPKSFARGEYIGSSVSGTFIITSISASTNLTPTAVKTALDTAASGAAGVVGQSYTFTVSGVTIVAVCAKATNDLAVYTYTINAGAAFPTGGLSFEKHILGGDSSLYVLLQGGRIDMLDLTISQKDIIKASWGIDFINSVASTSASQVSASAINYPTDDPVSGFDAFISLNGGLTFRPLREASLSIRNNVEKDVNVIGSRTRLDLPEGIRNVSGKLTTFFSDATEYNYFKNESIIPVVISIIHNGETLTFTMGECKLTGSGTPQVGGAGTITASFDFTAFKQSGTYDLICAIVSKTSGLFTLP